MTAELDYRAAAQMSADLVGLRRQRAAPAPVVAGESGGISGNRGSSARLDDCAGSAETVGNAR